MKNPRPSKQLLEATKNAMKAKAIVEVLRPKIIALQIEFLKEYEVLNENGERVFEPKEMYRVSDEKADAMYLALDRKYRAAGHKLPEEIGYCPLLMAENLQRQANREMNELAMELVPAGQRCSISSIWKMEDLQKLTDLNMQYVGQYVR